jgi:hypothetical protein
MTVSGVDSVKVRVHLYEREFPAKTVRRCDGCNEPRTQWTSKGRRTRQWHRHGAVSPDDRDMHVGRERPPTGRAWGEEGGSQVGVAHAPACLSAPLRQRAECDAGGVLRRRRQAQLADWQERERWFSRTRRATPRRRARAVASARGNSAPEFRFPHLVPPSQSRRRQPGREK